MSDYGVNSLGKRFSSLDISEQFSSYSGVEIIVDEDTPPYFSGDRNGRVLTIHNEWGTQEQADNILQALRGYQYQPMEAKDALLSPAAELGDGVLMNGVYSGLFLINRKYSPLMAADISAPQDEEIDHEYPFETKENRAVERRFTAVSSELALQSDKIAARVAQTGGDNSSFGWELLADHFSIFSDGQEVFRVDDDGSTFDGVITALAGGKIGNFNIGDSAIWNNIPDVENEGELTSGVYLGTDGIRLGQNFTVDPAGNVVAKRLELDTLVIGGASVSAASLNSKANHSYASTTSGGFCYTNAMGYKNATDQNSGVYPGFFRAVSIVTTNLTTRDATVTNLTFKNRLVSWKNITVNGTTYTVMAYG